MNSNKYCDCTDFHTSVVKKMQQYWFCDSDYDDVVWFDSDDADSKTHRLHTNHLTENLENVHIMCPKHHPFFYYLAGIVHLRPEEVDY